eukprot:IDg23923t1
MESPQAHYQPPVQQNIQHTIADSNCKGAGTTDLFQIPSRRNLARPGPSEMARNVPHIDNEAANNFVRMYYQISEHRPNELSLMYAHEATRINDASSTGKIEHVRDATIELPTASRPVRLMSMTSQRALDEGTVSIAIGSLPDGKVFLQMFLLKRLSEKRKLISCYHEIFTFISQEAGTSIRSLYEQSTVPSAFTEVQPAASLIHEAGSTTKIFQFDLNADFPPLGSLPDAASVQSREHPSRSPATIAAVSSSRALQEGSVAQLSAFENPAASGTSNNTRTTGAVVPPQLLDPTLGSAAVIKLSSFGSRWTSDLERLKSAVHQEFSSYGSPVRNVSIKPHMGFLFVDFESVEAAHEAVQFRKSAMEGVSVAKLLNTGGLVVAHARVGEDSQLVIRKQVPSRLRDVVHKGSVPLEGGAVHNAAAAAEYAIVLNKAVAILQAAFLYEVAVFPVKEELLDLIVALLLDRDPFQILIPVSHDFSSASRVVFWLLGERSFWAILLCRATYLQKN